ncbi:MAG: ISKra4 family transposase [Caldilineaceae bacterium]|nr:ISKra4 family transposase [Caldilineaceae bacterium]
MSSNSSNIVQDIRQEFESLVSYVEKANDEIADRVERQLFERLLGMGQQLMQLFFVIRGAESLRTTDTDQNGNELPYYGERKRDYFSLFGKVSCERPYFYQAGIGGTTPLDAQLSLGADCYSDLVREMLEYVGVDVPYEKAQGLFAHMFGQSISKNTIQGMVTEDAQDVVAYYEQKPAPKPEKEGRILVVQADGKGVPMVRETPAPAKVRLGKGDKRTKKKESIVTAIYTIEPKPRTPEDVVASIFHKDEQSASQKGRAAPVQPQHKQVWATLAGKDTALQRLAGQVAVRDGTHIEHRLALTDGAEALQVRVKEHCPDFTLILDFIHANEYLWKVGNCFYSEKDPHRAEWVEARTLQILSGKTEQLIAELHTLAQAPDTNKTQQEQLEKTANYFERNLAYMDYRSYLARGWPIASGVIEGACRHIVKDRLELSGMRWTQAGAENLLRLRSVAINGDWDDYHQFRKYQRHQRLYHLPFPQQPIAEDIALTSLSTKPTQTFHFNFTSAQSSPEPLAA